MMGRKYRSLEERLRLYNEVMRLRRLGLGYKRIAKAIEEKYGVSLNPGTICKWIKGRHHPLDRRCNKLVVGPGLAYTIGGWLGDGSLSEDNDNYMYRIQLSCKDYDFADEWGRCLAEALDRSRPYAPKWEENHKRWVVKGSSVLLYSLLKRAKDDPWILMPYLEKYPAEACRGFFDAEGWIEADYYRIVAGNTKSDVINLFKKLLGKLDIECRTHRCRQKEFMISPRTSKLYCRSSRFVVRLAIYGEENILRFAEKVGFTITRKQVELMKLVRRYRKSRKQ